MKKLLAILAGGCVVYCWGHWNGYTKAQQEVMAQAKLRGERIRLLVLDLMKG